MTLTTRPARLRLVALASLASLGMLTATACASTESAGPTADPTPTPRHEVTGPRLAVTYNGGILVLDRDTLEPVADLKKPGFLRLNPAGDQRHLFVSTSDGFQLLDTGVEVKGHGDHNHYFAGQANLTDIVHPAPEPGHVVRHADRTALFSDGAGTVQVLDQDHVADPPPPAPTWTAPDPHHGVAVPLGDGGLFVSVGTEEGRTGAAVLDSSLREVTRSNDCPDLHGEATSANGTVLAGCRDGALLFSGGAFTKVDSPDPYGRIGNQAGSEESDVVLGDYKTDPDAELERPTRVSLIDTASKRLDLVDLGTSYSFRSLARGPEGEALVFGTDGNLHIIDPATKQVTDKIKVTEPWQESTTWQDPRPTILVEDSTAWITEPAAKKIHVVHLPSKRVVDTVELPEMPNELSGVGSGHVH